MIMASSNWAKKDASAPAMGLGALWCRIREDLDYDHDTRMRKLQWVYNALVGIGTLRKESDTSQEKTDQCHQETT